MSILKIFTFPDAVLREKAQTITSFDSQLEQLASDMLETMYDAPGVGLAANQIGKAIRLIVLDTEYKIDGSEEHPGLRIYRDKKPHVFVNPIILDSSGRTSIEEGCLSVPGFTEEVARAQKLTLQYQDIRGTIHQLDAEDFFAIAIQHELDHLEGRLFIDRLSPVKRSIAKGKIRKQRAQKFERSKFHVEL